MSKVQKVCLLTLIKVVKPNPNARGLFQCECGNVKDIQISNVKCGHTTSCGCFKKRNPTITHGLRKHPVYSVWCNMKSRCYNSKVGCYNLYGGRGVRVCEEWISDFKSFFDWAINNGWEKHLKLDKDIKGDGLLYSPSTCCFVTNKENCNHTRFNHILTYDGVSRNVKQWSEFMGIKEHTLRHRLKKNNWDMAATLAIKWRV